MHNRGHSAGMMWTMGSIYYGAMYIVTDIGYIEEIQDNMGLEREADMLG